MIMNYLPIGDSELAVLHDDTTLFPALRNSEGSVSGSGVYVEVNEETADGAQQTFVFYPLRTFYIQPDVRNKNYSETAPWFVVEPGHEYRVRRIIYRPTQSSQSHFTIYKDGSELIYQMDGATHYARWTSLFFNWSYTNPNA